MIYFFPFLIDFTQYDKSRSIHAADNDIFFLFFMTAEWFPCVDGSVTLLMDISTDGLYCARLSRSVVSDSATPWPVARQALLFWGDSPGKNYRRRLPRPPPGDLPNPGIESRSPALQADSLPAEPLGKLSIKYRQYCRLENRVANVILHYGFLRT